MMNRTRTTLALAMCVALTAAGSAAAKTLVVDADGRATVSNCNSSTQTPYTSVSDALTDAVAFDKIVVCPGTYDEHVHITIPVTITGKNRAVIRPTVSGANTDSLASGAPIEAVILVGNATAVTGVILDNITVDASATGATYVSNCSIRLVGVFYRNASGTVRPRASNPWFLSTMLRLVGPRLCARRSRSSRSRAMPS